MSDEISEQAEEESIEMFESQPSGDDYEDDMSGFDDYYDDEKDEDPNEELKDKGIDEGTIDKLEEQEEKVLVKKEEKVEEKKEEGEEEIEEKPAVKSFKGKIGEDSVDIPEEATIKAMVNGKAEYPTVKELRDNYSGKQKWTQEIETAKSETRTARHEKEVMEADKQGLMDEVGKMATLVDEALEGKKSPIAAMEHFLKLTGRSVYSYNKLMVDQFGPIVRELDDMSEAEKNAFWYKLENEHLKSNRAAEIKNGEASKGLKEKEAKFSELRESRGVSQEQFVLAQQELKEMDYNDLTPEQVIKYVTVKPLYASANSAMSEYKDLIPADKFEAVQDGLVKYMQEDPDHTPQDIKEILIDALELGPIVKDLETKIQSDVPKQNANKSNKQSVKSYEVEDFDDFY